MTTITVMPAQGKIRLRGFRGRDSCQPLAHASLVLALHVTSIESPGRLDRTLQTLWGLASVTALHDVVVARPAASGLRCSQVVRSGGP